jgi:hypothetical protein
MAPNNKIIRKGAVISTDEGSYEPVLATQKNEDITLREGSVAIELIRYNFYNELFLNKIY